MLFRSGERVCVVIVPRDAQDNDLRAWLEAPCRQHLSGPKRPRQIELTNVLPRNPTGKVLKRELVRQLTNPV